MAKYFEVSDGKAAELYAAVKAQDGPAASKLLEDVGSCGWSSLLQKTNQYSRKRSDSSMADFYGNLVIGSSEKIAGNPHEVLHLFERPQRGVSGTHIPLASVTDQRCEKKPPIEK
ncbi:MAG: hypothetical protein Q8T09_00360 [Candidatus Melainabacteria bacterium]|jgi:hypothetical protein|nr:hypothetical protein [Candidatus Melainabacteria bacterium]